MVFGSLTCSVRLPITLVINENSIGLSDYLMLLKDQEPGVIELFSENFRDEGRYKET